MITTSSYQATLPGLIDAGLTEKEAEQIIALTVQLAKNARDKVWATLDDSEKAKRPYPLISGDVGPYAAYLANGSEYTGDYGRITIKELKEFHRPRIQILLDQGVDLLALETIPNHLEAQALIELLAEEFPEAEAYISFTVQEPGTISDGTSLDEIAQLVGQSDQILALGSTVVRLCSIIRLLLFLKMLEKPSLLTPTQVRFMMVVRRLGNLRTRML